MLARTLGEGEGGETDVENAAGMFLQSAFFSTAPPQKELKSPTTLLDASIRDTSVLKEPPPHPPNNFWRMLAKVF